MASKVFSLMVLHTPDVMRFYCKISNLSSFLLLSKCCQNLERKPPCDWETALPRRLVTTIALRRKTMQLDNSTKTKPLRTTHSQQPTTAFTEPVIA